MPVKSEEFTFGVVEDHDIKNNLKLLRFISDKFSQEHQSLPKNEKIETSSRFLRACVALKSNPFYKPPLGEVPSMEDVLAIDNPHEVRDQLR